MRRTVAALLVWAALAGCTSEKAEEKSARDAAAAPADAVAETVDTVTGTTPAGELDVPGSDHEVAESFTVIPLAASASGRRITTRASRPPSWRRAGATSRRPCSRPSPRRPASATSTASGTASTSWRGRTTGWATSTPTTS